MAQLQFRSDDTIEWKEGFGNGKDGDLVISTNSTFSAANAGCVGALGTKTLTLDAISTFANGDLILIHQSRGVGAGSWQLNKILSGAGTTTLTLAHDLTNTYTDSGDSQAQVLQLKQYRSVTVNTGVTWTVPAWDQNKGGIIAFLCKGTTTINGTIDGAAGTSQGQVKGGYQGGKGLSAQNAWSGEGTAGAAKVTDGFSNGSGGEGGHDYQNNAGAGGGNGTAGQSVTGRAGGSVSGNTELTLITFGGGGGGSGYDGGVGGNGIWGGGGGALGIIISKDFTCASANSITFNGSNGFAEFQSAGGAGAGGSLLLKGETINVGSGKIVAVGGSGVSGSLKTSGNGGTGRIHADYSKSILGTTSPTIDSRLDPTIKEMTSGGSFLLNFI